MSIINQWTCITLSIRLACLLAILEKHKGWWNAFLHLRIQPGMPGLVAPASEVLGTRRPPDIRCNYNRSQLKNRPMMATI
jgi:hypothetical protein